MIEHLVYRELSGFNEFEECARIQKDVFHLSDRDILPPIFINLLTRKHPRTGFAIGAFIKIDKTEKLIGFILAIAATENNSLYGIITGINPEYRKNGVGFGLFHTLKERASQHNINSFYGIFEPLEGNLANLYFDKFGMIGIKYEHDVYELADNNFPIDKILIKWDFNSTISEKKITKTYNKENLEELFLKYPIINQNYQEATEKVLIEIPADFIALKKEDPKKALEWRIRTKEIFNEYINNRNYQITEFYTRLINDTRENYYLLEKPLEN